ncbi:MAG: HlyD family efflux transporter periplasmic adaptor subunit [Planctomycetota bacterium]|nr:MAG: HlyD family efflux transporter periplasmic adaptor subunit [Planctomycetota bacterium]
MPSDFNAGTPPLHPSPPQSRRFAVTALGRALWAIPVLVAVAVGGAAWERFRHQQAETDRRQLTLQGNIDVRQVDLGFKVEGRIMSLAVDEGESVEPGAVIATLDRRYFDDDIAVARARRAAAAAGLAKLERGSRPEEIDEAKALLAERTATVQRAQSDFERADSMVSLGAVSHETHDLARATLSEAQARLTSAQKVLRLAELGPRQEDIDNARAQLAIEDAAVVKAQRRREDSELIAPSVGTILTRAREQGAIVNAGDTIYTLTLQKPVWVRSYVNERDLGRIRPDMPAEVYTDSAPDKPYLARIGFISPTAEFTPKSVETRELRTDLVYRLRVVIDEPDDGLRQGMPVTVIIRLDSEN